ncbi:MAG: YkgJ family cysteine cluster protein [Spirochaetales bacterium]|nr:YkgJ family cysteine cluster protein [Spirochaetales bacterium]
MKQVHEILPPGLPFGDLMDALSGVHRVYERAALEMAAFRDSSGVACPDGCGSCCESFIPDLTSLEAGYLAAFLSRAAPARALELALDGFSEAERDEPHCPFYRSDAAHCSVYEGRPLICRLFGYSGVRAKDGSSSFALCRRMDALPGRTARSWKGEDLGRELGAVPPLMSDLASELQAVRPNESPERRLLTDALPEALRKVLFLAGFGAKDPGDEPEPEPLAPMPRAG